jgi:hypothetical protein
MVGRGSFAIGREAASTQQIRELPSNVKLQILDVVVHAYHKRDSNLIIHLRR